MWLWVLDTSISFLLAIPNEIYDTDRGEYQVSKKILLSENDMANSEMEAIFKEHIAKTTGRLAPRAGTRVGQLLGLWLGCSLVFP